MRFLLACVLWLTGPVSALAAPTVLVLGDSLSAAYNMPIEQGWVALLERKLAESHASDWKIVNASISGETTSGGLTRLPAALKTHRPQLVLIELGGNDGLRGLQIAAMRANLARMIELSKAAGAKVGLIGVDLPGNYGHAFRGRFEAVYSGLAEEFALPLLPSLLTTIGTDLANFQDDQLHPNRAAQPLILEHVWQWLAPQLAGVVAQAG
mgnify:CR=1 FL=1